MRRGGAGIPVQTANADPTLRTGVRQTPDRSTMRGGTFSTAVVVRNNKVAAIARKKRAEQGATAGAATVWLGDNGMGENGAWEQRGGERGESGTEQQKTGAPAARLFSVI